MRWHLSSERGEKTAVNFKFTGLLDKFNNYWERFCLNDRKNRLIAENAPQYVSNTNKNKSIICGFWVK